MEEFTVITDSTRSTGTSKEKEVQTYDDYSSAIRHSNRLNIEYVENGIPKIAFVSKS